MPPRNSGAIRRPLPAPRAHAGVPVLPGVDVRLEGDALVLRFGTPGPGAWTQAFTADVARVVAQCRADARARRVVLTGPRLFGDERGEVSPELGPLLGAIAGAGTPVQAAIGGDAVGCGLELALCCQVRVMVPGGRMVLPGIRAGRLPVNGGVVRLSRLLPAEAGFEMLAFGTPVPAPVALRLGLVDALAEDPVAVRPMPAALRQVERFDLRPLEALLRRRAPGEAAPQAALQALGHALAMPEQRASAEIRRLAAVLAGSPQGGALRHAARAEAALACDAAAAASGPRLRWALLREAIHLVDEGASPEAVDLALRRFGFSTPPLAASDRDGLDAVAQACVDPRPDAWLHYSPLLDLLIDAGRTGCAAGTGWYRYAPADPTPRPDPALLPLLAESAAAARRRRRAMEEAEMVGRCIAAFAREAAGLIADGVAPLAVDGLSLAHGFPRWRGGIWHHVQATGGAAIATRLGAMPTTPPAAALLRAG